MHKTNLIHLTTVHLYIHMCVILHSELNILAHSAGITHYVASIFLIRLNKMFALCILNVFYLYYFFMVT